MLQITIGVNESDICTLGVHNTQEFRDDGRVKYDIYDIRGYEERGGTFDDYEKLGSVWHHREDGASKLTSLVMKEVGSEPFN